MALKEWKFYDVTDAYACRREKIDDRPFRFKFLSQEDEMYRTCYIMPIYPPLPEGENYKFTISWGDGTTEHIDTTADNFQLNHTYATTGVFTCAITDYVSGYIRMPEVVQNTDYDGMLYEVLTPFPASNRKSFSRAMSGSRRLQYVTPDVFSRSPHAEIFTGCFAQSDGIPNRPYDGTYLYDGLPDISGDLFNNNPLTKNVAQIFQDCIFLQKYPYDIFTPEKTPLITDFQWSFANCVGLTGEAQPLWEWFPNANGYACFRGCTGLSNYDQIPDNWK